MVKVAFVDQAKNFYDRHAIYSLSSVLESNGHKVYYVPKLRAKNIVNRLKEINPDLILYSSFTRDITKYAAIDRLAKKDLKIKSIIGGHGPTYDPEFVLNTTIDALCIGEGETAIIDYINCGFAANKNIIDKDNFNNDSCDADFYPFIDLDDIPVPDRSIVYEQDDVLRNQPSKQFMAGRGCPYQCTYCHNSSFNKKFKKCGPVIRYKSVDYLIEEISRIKNRYPLETVVFQDDVFILRKDWLKEFCEKFPRKIGLPFTCNVRAEIIVNEEIVKMLKEAGCTHAAWSIESGNDFFRNTILKRNMSKEQILLAASNLNKYKIPHRVGNVIGIPGEKFENITETLELNIKANPTLAIGSIFVPFPGLELTDYAIKNNYLDKENLKNLPDSLYERSVLNFTVKEKLKIQKIAYLFPLLISFPSLYHNKFVFYKVLLNLPNFLLRLIYNIFFITKMSGIFKIKASMKTKASIGYRYFFHS